MANGGSAAPRQQRQQPVNPQSTAVRNACMQRYAAQLNLVQRPRCMQHGIMQVAAADSRQQAAGSRQQLLAHFMRHFNIFIIL